MQQLRYFRRIGRELYPIKNFIVDLTQYTRESLQQGYKVIICLDANKNMVRGRVAKMFQAIRLIESIKLFHVGASPTIFIEGQY